MILARLTLLSVTGALAAAGVAGCAQQGGTKDKAFSGEAGRVANTIRDLDDAYNDEDNDKNGARNACRTLLSQRLVQGLGGKDCEKNARTALHNADGTDMDVRDVTFNAPRTIATAKVRLKLSDDQERIDTLKLVKEGQTWKFDGSQTGQKAPKKS